MSDLTEAREWLESRLTFHFQQSGWDAREAAQKATERIDALLSAHRSALAGETFPDDAASEAEFATCEADTYGWDGYHTEDAVRHARMFRRQRNALLAQLQDKEERIKALETEVEDIQSAMWCILAQGTGRAVITRKQIQERPTRARLKTATDVLGNLEIVALKEAP